MAKVLQMIFRNESGKSVSINLSEPKDNLTLTEVKTAMQDMVDKKVFTTTGGDLTQVVEARITSKDTTVLA